jgi:hypothetical protein
MREGDDEDEEEEDEEEEEEDTAPSLLQEQLQPPPSPPPPPRPAAADARAAAASGDAYAGEPAGTVTRRPYTSSTPGGREKATTATLRVPAAWQGVGGGGGGRDHVGCGATVSTVPTLAGQMAPGTPATRGASAAPADGEAGRSSATTNSGLPSAADAAV